MSPITSKLTNNSHKYAGYTLFFFFKDSSYLFFSSPKVSYFVHLFSFVLKFNGFSLHFQNIPKFQSEMFKSSIIFNGFQLQVLLIKRRITEIPRMTTQSNSNFRGQMRGKCWSYCNLQQIIAFINA